MRAMPFYQQLQLDHIRRRGQVRLVNEAKVDFDLSQARRNRGRFDLPVRLLAAAIGGVMLLTGLYVVLRAPASSGLQSVYLTAGPFVSLAGVFAVSAGLLLFLPGPSWISVSSGGVSYGRAASQLHPLVRWGDRRVKILLQDWRRSDLLSATYLQRRTGIMWASPSFHGFDISAEAFDAIIASARKAGLSVDECQVSTRPGDPGVREVRISTER